MTGTNPFLCSTDIRDRCLLRHGGGGGGADCEVVTLRIEGLRGFTLTFPIVPLETSVLLSLAIDGGNSRLSGKSV